MSKQTPKRTSKSRTKKSPKRVLALPDLEQARDDQSSAGRRSAGGL